MKVNLNFRVLIVLSYLLSAVLIQSFAQTGESVSPAKPLFPEKGLFDSDEVLRDYAQRKYKGPAERPGSRAEVFSYGTYIYKRRQQPGGLAGAGQNKGILPQDERKLQLSAFNDRFPERRASPFFHFQRTKKDQAGGALQGR